MDYGGPSPRERIDELLLKLDDANTLVVDLIRQRNDRDKEIQRLEDALTKIANVDYRGNRPMASSIAYKALKETP